MIFWKIGKCNRLSEMQFGQTKGHNYIKYFDLMRDDIRTASTEYGRAFITLNGKSYILNKHDNLNESENDDR